MKVVTNRFAQYGHREFAFCFELPFPLEHIERQIDMITDIIETNVATGTVYAPGDRLQLGWLINTLVAENDNTLRICEPDFEGQRFNWVPSASNTIGDMLLQYEVANSLGFGDSIDFPSCAQYGLICNQSLSSSGFYMSRIQRTGNLSKSGWRIGCCSASHDHSDPAELQWSTLYECAAHDRQIVPYLALPAGVRIADTGNPDNFFIDYQGKELAIADDSYLSGNLSASHALRRFTTCCENSHNLDPDTLTCNLQDHQRPKCDCQSQLNCAVSTY